MQLLNAVFPPYLMSYPVPSIQVQDIRVIREQVYRILMGPKTDMGRYTNQQKLLSVAGIDSGWKGEVRPALATYFDLLEEARQAFSDICGDKCRAATPECNGGPDAQPLEISAALDQNQRSTNSSPKSENIRSILKMPTSTSGQSISSASSYSELSVHPLFRELGFDEEKLFKTGLILPAAYANHLSFGSSKPTPFSNVSTQHENQSSLSSLVYRSCVESLSPCSDTHVHPTPDHDEASRSREDTTENKSIEELEQITTAQDGMPSKMNNGNRNENTGDSCHDYPALKAAKSSVALRHPRNHDSPPERTLNLCKSTWKSTEGMFAKFRGQDEDATAAASDIPPIPHNMGGSPSQRRPSKAVRFSDKDITPAEEGPETISTTQSPEKYTEWGRRQTTNPTMSRPKTVPQSEHVSTDPWKYARDYLIEKVNSQREGRPCTLQPPSPEWLLDEGSGDRNSLFGARSHRDAFAKLFSGNGTVELKRLSHKTGEDEGLPTDPINHIAALSLVADKSLQPNSMVPLAAGA